MLNQVVLVGELEDVKDYGKDKIVLVKVQDKIIVPVVFEEIMYLDFEVQYGGDYSLMGVKGQFGKDGYVHAKKVSVLNKVDR